MKLKIEIKNKIDSDVFIKVAHFKKDIRKTEAHRHKSYFEIIYLSKGDGTHHIDHATFQIKPPIFFFVRKEQIHHWDIQSVPLGYVLIIKKEFVEKSYDGELKKLLSKLSGLVSLQPKETETIEQLFELLIKENDFAIVEGLLKALLAKIFETSNQLNDKIEATTNLFQSYIDLLSKTDELKNSVSYYAKQLNTTPQNLNAVCKKSINLSASDVLSECIVNEAKRLLLYTDNTVSEIAFSLGFNDSSHFIKYFKRYTFQTPQLFRKE